MTSRHAAQLFALLTLTARGAAGQDTVAMVAPPTAARHVLGIDSMRLHPYRRTYEMFVVRGDSAQLIGEREVSMSAASYAGNSAWVIVETRTGAVPASESLFVSAGLRPMHWSSSLGQARLGIEFSGDSIYGVAASPSGRTNVVLGGRPDLIVSTAMLETILPLLPLGLNWVDSASVLQVDAASATVLPVALSVVGEEAVQVDSASLRPVWVVALRSETQTVLIWIEKESGEVRRVQQALPAHIGGMLEMRVKAAAASGQSPP